MSRGKYLEYLTGGYSTVFSTCQALHPGLSKAVRSLEGMFQGRQPGRKQVSNEEGTERKRVLKVGLQLNSRAYHAGFPSRLPQKIKR